MYQVSTSYYVKLILIVAYLVLILCAIPCYAQSTPEMTLTGNTTITAPLPDFKLVFFLQNTSDSTEINDLIVSTFPLWVSGTDSVLPQLKITPIGAPAINGTGQAGPLSLAPGGIIQVQFNARVIPEGEYKTLLILSHSNTLETHDLTINRTGAISSTFEIKGKNKVLGNSYGLGANPVTYEFHVINPGDEALSLEAPKLYSLGRSHADQDPVAASQQMVYLDEQGDSLAFPFTLDAKSDQKITLEILDLINVGNYTGTLTLRSAGAEAAVEQELNIQIRHYGLIALLVIAIGVGLSSFVRNYLTVTRVNLLSQQNILGLLQQINSIQQEFPVMNKIPQSLLNSINERLEDLLGKLKTQTVSDFNQKLEKETLRLKVFPGWLQAREELSRMQNPVISSKLKETFEKVEKFMGDTDIAEDEFKKLYDEVPKNTGSWVVKIKNATIEYVQEALKIWDENADQQAELIAFDESLVADIQTRNRYQKQIDQYIADGNYTEALETFDKARLAHIHILAGDLKKQLHESSDIPWMMDAVEAQSWEHMRKKWQEELNQIILSQDYETSQDLYLNVQAHYTRHMTQALQSWIGQQVKILNIDMGSTSPEGEQGTHAVNTPDVANQKEELEKYAQQLAGVIQKLDEQQYDEAYESYQSIETVLEALSQQLLPQTRSVKEFFPGVNKIIKPVFKKLVENVKIKEIEQKAAEGELSSMIDLSGLTRTLKLNDRLITGIALLLAAITGLLLLWQKDPTWGTWEDYLLAFLWGFGFEQAGQAAAKPDRLGNIREVFVK